ncbi:hypothetical protein BESB_032830 [Besnoitia besnoiti]|uniref:3-hydroxyisobutyrate dehydrogenase n=1 Tax=Besnoitia besnoiti TaxID=94643 RepID=A0A2A9M598_BESBE|nr:uncharacterized protein BESB_032830 [Besnoitia besnoiti]PFH31086.1 hypothetical protein BESB_032830 [Besnoitia besnoiti]
MASSSLRWLLMSPTRSGSVQGACPGFLTFRQGRAARQLADSRRPPLQLWALSAHRRTAMSFSKWRQTSHVFQHASLLTKPPKRCRAAAAELTPPAFASQLSPARRRAPPVLPPEAIPKDAGVQVAERALLSSAGAEAAATPRGLVPATHGRAMTSPVRQGEHRPLPSFSVQVAGDAYIVDRPGEYQAEKKKPRQPLVGFVGLGNMGLRMATVLGRCGVQLCVYDVMARCVRLLEESFGAVPASSVEDLGHKVRESHLAFKKKESAKAQAGARGTSNATPRCPIVISMLPTANEVRDVVLSKGGLLDGLTGDKAVEGHKDSCSGLVVDCSTVGPNSAVEIAQEVRERGHRMIDAPVSGGIPGATNGNLTFMIGGAAEDVEVASPVLNFMAKKIFHCGESVGTGQVFKVCNNLILATTMLGVAEAFRLGKSAGVDLKLLNEVVNASSGRCWTAETYNPAPLADMTVPANRGYKSGFSCELMAKDLALCQETFKAQNLTCPVTDVACSMFGRLCDEGHAKLDIGCAFVHNI